MALQKHLAIIPLPKPALPGRRGLLRSLQRCCLQQRLPAPARAEEREKGSSLKQHLQLRRDPAGCCAALLRMPWRGMLSGAGLAGGQDVLGGGF